MTYKLIITPDAQDDMDALKKSGDKVAMKKLNQILSELREHPEAGNGQPERLKHTDQERWSRRINRKHRILYQIFDQEALVLVLYASSHYGDK